MAEITCPLSSAASTFGKNIALIENSRRLTYSELDAAVSRLSEDLSNEGVARGDRIAIVDHNRLDYAVALFALFRLGAVACLFSHRLGASALEEMVVRARCQAQLQLPGSDRRFHTLPVLQLPAVEELTIGMNTAAHPISLNQPATIMATSGSTGRPKLVLHTYGNHYCNALGSNRNLPLKPGDRWLVSLSLYHVGGLAILFRCLLVGATAVLSEPSTGLIEEINRHHTTHISVVAAQLRRLLTADNPKSLRAVLLGGGPAPESLVAEARQAGLPLYLSYGLTEMASQVSTSSSDSPDRVKRLDHRQLSLSEKGEILVRGETLFKGYVEGDRIDLPLDPEGWFHTGDLGTLDSDGGLTVIGRIDNMFVCGGENVHPEEIESALQRQNEIVDAVVVPVEDAEFDFRPAAFIRYASTEQVLSDDVLRKRLLGEGLPRFKIPTAFLPWPEQAMVNEMKPGRGWLRREAARLLSKR